MSTTEDNDDRFLFSIKRAAEAERDLDLQIDAIDAHMEKLYRKVELGGIPILRHILQLTHDEEDLMRLSKALEKLAPLATKRDDLAAKKAVFKLANMDPNWLKWAFADLESDVDEIISRFEKRELDE